MKTGKRFIAVIGGVIAESEQQSEKQEYNYLKLCKPFFLYGFRDF